MNAMRQLSAPSSRIPTLILNIRLVNVIQGKGKNFYFQLESRVADFITTGALIRSSSAIYKNFSILKRHLESENWLWKSSLWKLCHQKPPLSTVSYTNSSSLLKCSLISYHAWTELSQLWISSKRSPWILDCSSCCVKILAPTTSVSSITQRYAGFTRVIWQGVSFNWEISSLYSSHRKLIFRKIWR